jgi:hypothetical protein
LSESQNSRKFNGLSKSSKSKVKSSAPSSSQKSIQTTLPFRSPTAAKQTSIASFFTKNASTPSLAAKSQSSVSSSKLSNKKKEPFRKTPSSSLQFSQIPYDKASASVVIFSDDDSDIPTTRKKRKSAKPAYSSASDFAHGTETAVSSPGALTPADSDSQEAEEDSDIADILPEPKKKARAPARPRARQTVIGGGEDRVVGERMDDGFQAKVGFDESLPPISDINDIFEDMVKNLETIKVKNMEHLSIKKAVEHIGSHKLRVATMCSGTESPILALDLVSESKSHLFFACFRSLLTCCRLAKAVWTTF